MAVTLTGTGGLYTRLGKLGKALREINTYQGTTIPAWVSGIMGQYDGLRDVAGSVPGLTATGQSNASAVMATIKTVAENTLLRMVLADKPSMGTTVANALAEIITQMRASSDSVKASTIACSGAALTGNNGSGVVVLTTKRGDGLVQELSVAEVGPLVCTADSQTGSAALSSEQFRYTGQRDVGDPWAYDWPTGSGASATLTAIDAALDASGNTLTNSDFETFTSNTPNKWTVLVGTPGTHLKASTTTYLTGTKSLEIVGNGSTLTSITQIFNDSTNGTAGVVSPSRSYALNFWCKADVVPAAGVLTVDLIDADGNVIADDQSTSNTYAVTLSAITTSFAAKNTTFRLPKALPSSVRLRVRLSTAMSAGSSLFIDRLAMAPVTQLYPGGPGACVFSGATKFIAGDGWLVTTTNDRGSATLGSTFHALFDRFFGMRALGLLLPSAGSPTIADTLITA